jgi:hypothetical protein
MNYVEVTYFKYLHCHTLIYTADLVFITFVSLQPNTIPMNDSSNFLRSNMDDGRLEKVPGDVIGHDYHLDKQWE